jgi:DNA-binding NarL/FixJ family response regulator
MEEQTRIVIADDHPIFRSGLRQVIDTDPTLRVVGEAADGEAALKMIIELAPDVVVLDVNMPGLTGFAVVESMRAKGLAAEIVMLTMHNEEAMFAKALSLGVRGYVLKDSAVSDIVNCLHAVRRGQNFTSAEVTKFLFKRASGQTKPVEGLESLTLAERRVLAMIAEYMTSREIAEKLSVSVRTVENHRTNICAKLGVNGSHALMKFALQHQSSL